MKRRRLVAVAALTAAISAFLVPASLAGPVYKASDWCQDGVWQDVPILNYPVSIGVEVGQATTPDGPAQWVTICVSTNPTNDTSTEVIGGYYKVFLWNDGYGYAECDSNYTALVRVECLGFWAPTGFTDQNPGPGGTVSFFASAQGLHVDLDATGAELGTTPTNTTSTTSVGQSGTCVWVLGRQMLPGCNAAAAEAHTEAGDVTPAVSSAGPQACAGVYANGTCIGTWVTVPLDGVFIVIGTDPDQTVGLTAMGVGTGYDPGRVCVGTAPC